MSLIFSLLKFVRDLEQNSVHDSRVKAAEGDAKEQYDLGTAYFEGRGVPQNDWEAAYWFQLAAAQGHPRAQTNLGIMHLLGRGVSRDVVEGYKWLAIAAKRGHVPAKTALAKAAPRLTAEEIESAEMAATDFLQHWEMEQQAVQEADEERRRVEQGKETESEPGSQKPPAS